MRNIFLWLYNNTKVLYKIEVQMDAYNTNKPNDFIKHYYRVNKLLRKKYKLEIPITEELYKKFLDGELERVYEIYGGRKGQLYNKGKVVLSLEATSRFYKVSSYTYKAIFVIYNNDQGAGEAVDFAKKIMSDDGSDDF